MDSKPQPKPPQPTDFHITEDDIAQYDQRERRLSRLEPRVCFAMGTVFVASLGLANINWSWTFSDGLYAASTYFGLIGLAIAWLFLSFLCCIPAAFIVLPICKLLLNHSPNAEPVRRYKRAATEFRIWLERSRSSWWRQLDGRRFEIELARLFRAKGWQATATKASGDGGIDIVGSRSGVKFVAQCKNHKKEIGPAPIRELYGVLLASDAEQAIFASVSGFTKGAKEFARGKPMQLIDLHWILSSHMELDASWKSLMSPRGRVTRVSIRLKHSL